MSGFRLAAQLISILATLAVSAPASATSFFERPFPDAVKEAPVIVRGAIGNTYVDWGHERDGGKRIFTYWELRVAEVFKGAAENGLLRIREMGGEKDGTGMQVSGAATFGPGEDVVVFLEDKNGEGSYDIDGMMMGKYGLKKDADGQDVLVGPGMTSLSKPRIYDGDEAHPVETPGTTKWTLEALRKLIASQSNAPTPAAAAPAGIASPLARVAPQEIPTQAAPQLQIPPTEALPFPTGLFVAIGVVIAGALGFFFFVKKRS